MKTLLLYAALLYVSTWTGCRAFRESWNSVISGPPKEEIPTHVMPPNLVIDANWPFVLVYRMTGPPEKNGWIYVEIGRHQWRVR